MQKDVLVELLADACGGKKPKHNVFELAEEEKASLLLDSDGPHAIDAVTRVEVKEGYAVVRASRDTIYLVGLERILGLRLLRAKREGLGFHA